MVAKTKRNGGNTHDKRHENGLAAPGKRIAKQKSNPQLNGSPNGRTTPSPPLPSGAQGLLRQHMTQSGTASTAAAAPGPLASNDNNSTMAGHASAGPAALHGRAHHPADGSLAPTVASQPCRQCDSSNHHHNHQRPDGSSSSSPFDFDVPPQTSSRPPPKGPSHAANILTVATTILSSCPLRDVLAILIILLQLPPTVLTIVQFLFATLTFVPPQAGTPLSALSAFPSFTDIFQGSGGTPSLFTIVFADALILVLWLLLWVPVQNFFLDLAQAVIAIALGGAAAGRNGTTNSVIICFCIILTNHLFRLRPLRQHIVHFLWTGLARGGLDFLTSPPSTPPNIKGLSTAHSWPRSLLGIHILAQGVVRMIRRYLSRRDAVQPLPAGKKTDPEAGVNPSRTLSATDSNVDVPGSSSTDGRPPGPSPALHSIKDKASSSRKKRKQATHVRSQQPFWAALASTKVTVLKEMESSRAANDAGEANAKDANHIGNALYTGEEDRVWISQVDHSEISFRVSMDGESISDDAVDGGNGHAVSGIDRTKPFYLRVNGADWSSTRIRPCPLQGNEGTGMWEGEVFGLTALSNYFCEFVRTVDDGVFFSTSLITSTGPVDEQIPVVSPPAHQTLRPQSPTTTLKNSIAAADQKLQDQRNRLKRNRKDHKAAITAIKKELDMLQNRLATAGGSDERQRQRVLQFNQSIRQADEASADISQQIDSLGDIPRDELDNAAAKKKAWKQERDHRDAVSTGLQNLKAEIERLTNSVKSDINSVLQKRERLQQRQTTLNEKHERLITANREGFSAKQRKEQERAAAMAEKMSIEHQYRSNINNYERRVADLNAATVSTLSTIQHLENLLLQQAQQAQSIPATPEGPLPGTTNSFSPHANGFSPASNAFSSFTFPSLTAQVNSTPSSVRGGRGRSSSMLSNVSGFTDGFEESTSPSAIHMNPNLFGVHGPFDGRNGSNGSGSLSSGTSSQSSSQRDPMSPVPKKPVMVRSSTAGSGGFASPIGSR